MPITDNPVRSDPEGDGSICARRGGRFHKGVDFEVRPGTYVESPVNGVVTRTFQCYSDTDEYKGVELRVEYTKDDRKFQSLWRFLYLSPIVFAMKEVRRGDALGLAQDISKRYGENMKPHVHVEVNVDPRSELLEEI